jgi:hypothetical protein
LGLMASISLAALQEATTQLPVPPLVFGAGAFVGLMVLMFALLVFGRGRPHS